MGPSFGERHTVDGRFDAVAVVDVDNDGDPDVVTAEGDWLRIHENVAGRMIARDVVTTEYASPVAIDTGESMQLRLEDGQEIQRHVGVGAEGVVRAVV